MFSRLVAGWLVVLVLAPFTAPFPTCDLATVFGHGVDTAAAAADARHTHGYGLTTFKQTTESPRTARVIRRARRDESPVTPSSATLSNDEFMLGVSSFLSASRSRLLLIACASPLSKFVPSSSAADLKSLQPVYGITDVAAAGTVLRV
jgi:hypothetical protein